MENQIGENRGERRLSAAVEVTKGCWEATSVGVGVGEQSAAAATVYRAGPDGLVGVAHPVSEGLL